MRICWSNDTYMWGQKMCPTSAGGNQLGFSNHKLYIFYFYCTFQSFIACLNLSSSTINSWERDLGKGVMLGQWEQAHNLYYIRIKQKYKYEPSFRFGLVDIKQKSNQKLQNFNKKFNLLTTLTLCTQIIVWISVSLITKHIICLIASHDHGIVVVKNLSYLFCD